jgi:hypothetical protein
MSKRKAQQVRQRQRPREHSRFHDQALFKEKVTQVTKKHPQTIPLKKQNQIALPTTSSQGRGRVPEHIVGSDGDERLVFDAASEKRTAENGRRAERIGQAEKVCEKSLT